MNENLVNVIVAEMKKQLENPTPASIGLVNSLSEFLKDYFFRVHLLEKECNQTKRKL